MIKKDLTLTRAKTVIIMPRIVKEDTMVHILSTTKDTREPTRTTTISHMVADTSGIREEDMGRGYTINQATQISITMAANITINRSPKVIPIKHIQTRQVRAVVLTPRGTGMKDPTGVKTIQI